jgi:hypothetical protein
MHANEEETRPSITMFMLQLPLPHILNLFARSTVAEDLNLENEH